MDNLLTKVSGKLLSTALDAQYLNLSIQSEKTVFTASLPLSPRVRDVGQWSPGDRLNLLVFTKLCATNGGIHGDFICCFARQTTSS